MKMAKASNADIAMAINLATYLDSIDGGHVPDSVSDDPDAIEWLDESDSEQCARIIRGLREILKGGSIFRVVWGMAVVCDPKNEVIDPDASVLEIHPKHVKAAEQRDELLAVMKAVNAKFGSRPYGTGSYIPRSLRDRVASSIASVEGGAA